MAQMKAFQDKEIWVCVVCPAAAGERISRWSLPLCGYPYTSSCGSHTLVSRQPNAAPNAAMATLQSTKTNHTEHSQADRLQTRPTHLIQQVLIHWELISSPRGLVCTCVVRGVHWNWLAMLQVSTTTSAAEKCMQAAFSPQDVQRNMMYIHWLVFETRENRNTTSCVPDKAFQKGSVGNALLNK